MLNRAELRSIPVVHRKLRQQAKTQCSVFGIETDTWLTGYPRLANRVPPLTGSGYALLSSNKSEVKCNAAITYIKERG